jgi:hypothetical protein
MNRFTAVLLAASIALTPAVTARAQTTPSFQIMDMPLLSGNRESYPSSINNLSQVAGGSQGCKLPYGWVWTPGASTVPVLPIKAFSGSYAIDINDAGTVAGKSYSGDWSGSTNCKATLWLNGAYSTPVDLDADTLKSVYLPGWTLRQAVAVSNPDPADGSYYVVCYGQYVMNGATITKHGAVLKMQGSAISFAVPLAPIAPDAVRPYFGMNNLNINNVGQVCGTSSSTSPTYPGTFRCIWNATDGQLTFTSITSGNTRNIKAINDSGVIAGELSAATGAHAYISESPYASVDFLKTQLPGIDGDCQTIPFGMNNSHQVVGQAVYTSNLARIAAYWKVQTDATTGQPLRDGYGNVLYSYYDLARCYITGTSVVKSFWQAQAINDSGWIVVDAKPTSTTHRAVVLIPK